MGTWVPSTVDSNGVAIWWWNFAPSWSGITKDQFVPAFGLFGGPGYCGKRGKGVKSTLDSYWELR